MTFAPTLPDAAALVPAAVRESPLAFLASLRANRDYGELFVCSETVSIGGAQIHVSGIAVDLAGECVTGSAASMFEDPMPRAVMELRERMTLIDAIRHTPRRIVLVDARRRPVVVVPSSRVFPISDAPDHFRWARSNGVAAGQTWSDAARRARLELVERDRVLRSWYGEIVPRIASLDDQLIPAPLMDEYDVSAYAFNLPGADIFVAGVFGFPRSARPMICGFGARETWRQALATACGEALQRLGFLWDEPLPDAPPAPAPTPDFHQEYFLHAEQQEVLRSWLRGEHERHRGALRAQSTPRAPLYVDLTPADSGAPFFVAKAVPNGHVPLGFGLGHPLLDQTAPTELLVHPIA